MKFKTYNIRLMVLTFISSLLMSCASSVQQQSAENKILQVSHVACKSGFLRPPGTSRCLNIQELLDGKHNAKAPIGACPTDWRKLTAKGYCLPKFTLVVCGQTTFACGKTLGDTFRTKDEPIKCVDGTMVVLGSAPSSDSGELYLGSKVVLACGPFTKVDPV